MHWTRSARLALILAVAGCGGAGQGAAAARGGEPPAAGPACPQPGETTGRLHWYVDDYATAAGCAKASGKPLFIDLWAVWCHTCRSMKNYIFPDPGLAGMADRFVWLALDTDVELNAPALTKFPAEVWPTFYVVDADTETIQARYLGSGSVGQMREFMRDAELAYVGGRSGQLAADDPIRLVRDGVRAESAGDLQAADKAYGAALAAAPARWPRRPDLLVSRIRVLDQLEDWTTCAALAAGAAEQTGDSASAADFAYYGLDCAGHLGDAEQKHSLQAMFEARLARLVADPSAPLSVDDRADALRTLRDTRAELGDRDGARQAAEAGRALLDQAAAEAPSPGAAATHNYLRVDFYMWLDRGREMIPVLERSAADLPRDYDPPYRLASVLLGLGEPGHALEAARRALALAYGPRKARVQGLIADIQHALGDRDGELAARRAVVDILEQLPDGQKLPRFLDQSRKALADLEAKP